MLIAQITDLHLSVEGGRIYGGRVDANAMTRRAVERLNDLSPQPDLVLVTGDIVDHGTAEEYAVARGILDTIAAPVTVMIGNHDEREAFRRELADYAPLPAEGFLHYVLESRPLRIVALDSTTPAHHGGEFCAERAAWLDARLTEQPDVPTLVALHHPPFNTGIAWMDGEGTGWARQLLDVLARHRHVVRVICGHLHRPIIGEAAGHTVAVAPSVAHQVALDLTPNADILENLPEFEMEPAGFALHDWDGATLRTHFAHVETWPRFHPISREILAGLLEARETGVQPPKQSF